MVLTNLISESCAKAFQDKLNAFLLAMKEENQEALEIEFSTCVDDVNIYYSALVIYLQDNK